jgi:hypothetical protein
MLLDIIEFYYREDVYGLDVCCLFLVPKIWKELTNSGLRLHIISMAYLHTAMLTNNIYHKEL